MKKLSLIFVAMILISVSGASFAEEGNTNPQNTATNNELTDVTDLDWGIDDDDNGAGYD